MCLKLTEEGSKWTLSPLELLGWSWFMCFPIKYDRFSPPVWRGGATRWMHLKPIFSNVWESYRDFISQKRFLTLFSLLLRSFYIRVQQQRWYLLVTFSHPAQLRSPTVKYHQRKNVPILLPPLLAKFTPFSSLSSELIFQNISLKGLQLRDLCQHGGKWPNLCLSSSEIGGDIYQNCTVVTLRKWEHYLFAIARWYHRAMFWQSHKTARN